MFWTVIVFFLVCAVCLYGWLSLAGSSGHSFRDQCERCHLNLKKDRPVSPSDMLFTKDVSALCLECHKTYGRNSHPTGMIPTLDIPVDMPLSRLGTMTCVTCHFPHVIEHNDASRLNPMLLRRPFIGKRFCQTCHVSGFDEMKHESVLVSAHGKQRKLVSNITGGVLDPYSRECVECHDDSFVPGADLNLRSGIWFHASGIWHPIGVPYPTTFPKNRDYRPKDQLDDAVILIDDETIGCVTCHDKFSDRPKYLVMSNKNSQLCLACHIK